jgi:hypothetical protein
MNETDWAFLMATWWCTLGPYMYIQWVFNSIDDMCT